MAALVLFLILFGVPAAEIALFVLIGGEIGVWSTLGVVALTAVIGAILVRAQGISVLRELQETADRGESPLGPMISGVCLLIAGLLLVTPGFLTDTIGFALLIPPVRLYLGALVVRSALKHGTVHRFGGGFGAAGGPGRPGGHGAGRGETIDGDYVDMTERDDTPSEDPDETPPKRIDGDTAETSQSNNKNGDPRP